MGNVKKNSGAQHKDISSVWKGVMITNFENLVISVTLNPLYRLKVGCQQYPQVSSLGIFMREVVRARENVLPSGRSAISIRESAQVLSRTYYNLNHGLGIASVKVIARFFQKSLIFANLPKPDWSNAAVHACFTSFLAGLGYVIPIVPFDSVYGSMIKNHLSFRQVIDLKTKNKSFGEIIRGFYKGAPVDGAKFALDYNLAMFIGGYLSKRDKLKKQAGELSSMQQNLDLFLASISGALLKIIPTHILDTVKTYQQGSHSKVNLVEALKMMGKDANSSTHSLARGVFNASTAGIFFRLAMVTGGNLPLFLLAKIKSSMDDSRG